jgi:hypothetical protein
VAGVADAVPGAAIPLDYLLGRVLHDTTPAACCSARLNEGCIMTCQITVEVLAVTPCHTF